jgi:hypothetical protein
VTGFVERPRLSRQESAESRCICLPFLTIHQRRVHVECHITRRFRCPTHYSLCGDIGSIDNPCPVFAPGFDSLNHWVLFGGWRKIASITSAIRSGSTGVALPPKAEKSKIVC